MTVFYDEKEKSSSTSRVQADAEIRRIEKEIDEFCKCCEFRRDFGGYEDCGGARVYIPDWTCPADMDPRDLGCRRYEEYKELTDRRAELDGLIFPSYRSETEQKYKEEQNMGQKSSTMDAIERIASAVNATYAAYPGSRAQKWDQTLQDVDDQIQRLAEATDFDPEVLRHVVEIISAIANSYERPKAGAAC